MIDGDMIKETQRKKDDDNDEEWNESAIAKDGRKANEADEKKERQERE